MLLSALKINLFNRFYPEFFRSKTFEQVDVLIYIFKYLYSRILLIISFMSKTGNELFFFPNCVFEGSCILQSYSMFFEYLRIFHKTESLIEMMTGFFCTELLVTLLLSIFFFFSAARLCTETFSICLMRKCSVANLEQSGGVVNNQVSSIFRSYDLCHPCSYWSKIFMWEQVLVWIKNM